MREATIGASIINILETVFKSEDDNINETQAEWRSHMKLEDHDIIIDTFKGSWGVLGGNLGIFGFSKGVCPEE